jgi:hypothetical protein
MQVCARSFSERGHPCARLRSSASVDGVEGLRIAERSRSGSHRSVGPPLLVTDVHGHGVIGDVEGIGTMIVSSFTSEEPFVSFAVPRSRVPLASHFRSTWLSSSLNALRERNHFDRYLALLAPADRATILESVAGVWLPIDVGLTHYRACDALDLGKRESWEIGVEVTRKVHGTSLALAFRLAKQAGVTPWTIFAQMPRLWERIWRGGGIAVHKHGPKEAIIEAIQWPVAGIPYVRQTMPAVVHGVVELFCAKVYVTEVPRLMSQTSLGFRVQWA